MRACDNRTVWSQEEYELQLRRAYHVGGNGGKLPPLGPRGEFSLHWGELLVTYKASVLLFALKTELLLLVLTVQAICNVWAVLILCAKTRNHGRGNVMSR